MPDKASKRQKEKKRISRSPSDLRSWLNAGEIAMIVVVSLCFAGSEQYTNQNDFSITLGFFARFMFFTALFAACVVLVKHLFMRKPSEFALPALIANLSGKTRFALMVALMLLAWTPIVVSLYPGTLSADTMAQLANYINAYVEQDGTVITDQHPPFTTLIFGWFFVVVGSALGSLRYAFFLYVILQAITVACTFSLCVRYLGRLGLSQLWQLVVYLFFCLHPLFPILVVNISKDSLFSWIFLLFVMGFMEIIRTSGKVLNNWWFVGGFSILGTLCCLTKNFGVYVVAPSLLVAVLVFRKDAVKALIPCFLSLAVTFGGVPAAEAEAGIASGHSAPAILSVPLQQTARYAVMHDDEVTDSERHAVEAVLGNYDELRSKYLYYFADPVINGYRGSASEEEKQEYWKTWLAQGLNHPTTYFDAWAALESRWFSFTPMYAFFHNDHYEYLGEQFKGPVPESAYGKNSFTEKSGAIVNKFHDVLINAPVISILFSEGLYAILIPVLSLILVMRGRDKRWVLALLPAFLVIAKLLISPTSNGPEAMRYVMCLVYLAPLLISCGKMCFATGVSYECAGNDQRVAKGKKSAGRKPTRGRKKSR